MAVLYILAGPNGAGETTFYQTILKTGYLNEDLPFLYVDLIVKDELGDYSPENFSLAETIYRERIRRYFENGNDFMIESNLARDADYTWIESVKKRGYDIVLFFPGTNLCDININRVKKRVAEVGHDIPVPIIEHRYAMSLVYLKTKLRLFNEVFLIDNSTELPQEIAVLKNGTLISKTTNDLRWVNDVLSLEERLGNRK